MQNTSTHEYNIGASSSISESASHTVKHKNITSLSKVMRLFGACAVLVSISIFLFDGWVEGNDVQRYLKLLAQTGLLTAGGIALSLGIKEFKGARLFFGLSLVSVAANFTVLGALVYSLTQWDDALHDYPGAFTWQAVEPIVFWPIFAGALLLLAVLSRFSYAIFARQHAATLCASFLLLCGGLLIPVRDSIGISIVAGLALWVAVRVLRQVRKSSGFVQTTESNFALATLFLPPAIIVIRALSLYHVDEILAITLSGLVLFALRTHSLLEFESKSEHLSGVQRLSGTIQFLLAINISIQLTALLPELNNVYSVAVLSFVMLFFSVEFIFSNRHVRLRRHYLFWTVLILTLANATGVLIDSAVSNKIASLLVALACTIIAYLGRLQFDSKHSLSIAIFAVILSVAQLGVDLINMLQLTSWVIIGLIGGGLIVAASFSERMTVGTSSGHRPIGR